MKEEINQFPLSWRETWDDNNNSILEANGPFTDEEGCCEFEYRIKQRLMNNKIEFYEASDAELMEHPNDPETWESLKQAEHSMQKRANKIAGEIEQ